GGLAAIVPGVAAVDQHRDRDAIDAAALGDLGLGRARNLVVDDLLGLAGLLAAAAGIVLFLRGAGQLVADGDLALAAVGGAGGFLPRLARAHDAAFRVEFLRGRGDAVEVEIGGELYAGAPRAAPRGDDALDLLAQALLVGGLPFIGAHPAGDAVAL